MATSNQYDKIFGNNGWFNWNDIFLPGSSALIKAFDLTGERAANKQFENQKALIDYQDAKNDENIRDTWAHDDEMSNTSIQRQVADAEAAGFNPYIMMAGGNFNGASTPSGSSASVSSGNADMANNKMAAAAGVIAVFLRVLLAKH